MIIKYTTRATAATPPRILQTNFLLNNFDTSNIYWIELVIEIDKKPGTLNHC